MDWLKPKAMPVELIAGDGEDDVKVLNAVGVFCGGVKVFATNAYLWLSANCVNGVGTYCQSKCISSVVGG